VQTFLEHIHEEEHVMLPALRDELEEAQLRELGRRFEDAKQHMPTRWGIELQCGYCCAHLFLFMNWVGFITIQDDDWTYL
jgi:hypothetical protein